MVKKRTQTEFAYRRLVILLITLYTLGGVFAQQNANLRGKVTDNSGAPIIGATIMIEGTTIGAVTDIDGNFTIQAPSKASTLLVRYLGFDDKKIEVNTTTTSIDIMLEESIHSLDELIVVGYGEYSRHMITSSISKFDGEELKDIPVSSAAEGLKGKIAGVAVKQTDNSPEGAFSIKIRGGSSISNSNAPLVLVDGVEREFASLNPNDIKSIDVLKDAASTAIYGARGSNGVVLVTTNKGSFNQPLKITFEATLAHQEAATLREFLNGKEYLTVMRKAAYEGVGGPGASAFLDKSGYSFSINNSGSSIYSPRIVNEGDVIPDGWKTMIDPITGQEVTYSDIDWQSILFRPSLWQNYYLGVSGGNDRLRYSGSVGYTDDGGIGLNTSYNRFSFTNNSEAKISEWLSFSTDINYQRTQSESYENQRDIISRGLSATPVQIVYFEDGTPAPGYNASSQTPTFFNHYTDNNSTRDRLSLSGTMRLRLADGWSANIQGSWFTYAYRYTSFTRENLYSASRESTLATTNHQRKKLDAYTQYKHEFGKHGIDLMGGYSYMHYLPINMQATGTGSPSDKLTELNSSSETTVTSNSSPQSNIGFFSRINYDYDKKYLLTLTGRYDASSKFPKDNRWGFFPGMSAGWIVSEEDWFNDFKAINYAKLRTSLGMTGNSNVGVNAAYGSYNSSNTYDKQTAIYASTMPNLNLTWETTTQLDIGAEIGLFNNRIYLSADYYDKHTRNLLYSMSLPNTTGYGSVQTNLGVVRFYGWEFDLSTRNIVTDKFSWDSKLIFSTSKNRVISLPTTGYERNRTGTSDYPIYSNGDGTYFGGLAEGEPLYRFYGYKAIGIYQTDAEAEKAPFDQLARGYSHEDGTTVLGRKFAGDYNWADRNGDGIITKNQDLFCLGVTEPTLTGGVSNTFKYSNWTLSVYLDYALGHSIHDESFGRYFYSTFTGNYALAKDVLQTWSEPGQATRYAKFWFNDSGAGQDNFHRTSNVFTYKGDYLCIRDVALSYTFPKKMCDMINVKGLQLTVAGNTLHYFAATPKGISPEIGTASTYDGANYNNYPPVRKFSFSTKLTF